MLPARTKATVRVNKDTDRAEAKKALASVKSPGGHRWDALPKARFAADSLGLVAADRRFGPSLPCFLQ
jgi:hypothetical protein